MEWAVSWDSELLINHTCSISEYLFFCYIPAQVKIDLLFGNQQVTNTFLVKNNKLRFSNIEKNKLVGTSEAIRPLTSNISVCSEVSWNQWLSGLIDGDGCLLISPKGYASCEITMGLKDEHALMQIKQKLGGSLKLRSGSKSIRYRLHHKKGIENLLYRINGEIRNSVRLEQLKKMCDKFNINFKKPTPITCNNAWFAGFFDADGTITMSIKNDNPQLTISVSNKKEIDIIYYKNVFKGNIYFDKGSHGSYKWTIQSELHVLEFLNYIKKYPARSNKKQRLFLIPRYYELKKLKAYKAEINSLQFKAWNQFLLKWESIL